MTGRELIRSLSSKKFDPADVVVCHMEDGSAVALTETNLNGGLCDDCSNVDFLKANVTKANLYSYAEGKFVESAISDVAELNP